MRGRPNIVTVVFCLLLAACSTSRAASQNDTEVEAPTPSIRPLATDSASTTEPENRTMDKDETTEPNPECERLTDFSTDSTRNAWQTVNDSVMGGRSSGGPTFTDDVMTFAGDINTDGGGFSSLRLRLEPGTLSDFDRVILRARPDDRSYMITFDDNVSSRDRRVSHRAVLNFAGQDEWQEIAVLFSDLSPALFGRPIQDLPFDKTLATRMGIMISDGNDGPFKLEVDWVDLCKRS